MNGFFLPDGYAAVPFGKGLMIIYKGQQIDVVKTEAAARRFIEAHKATPKTGTSKPRATKKSDKVNKTKK
jgi:hypothetical protein